MLLGEMLLLWKDSTSRRRALQQFQRELVAWKEIISGFTGSLCQKNCGSERKEDRQID